MGAKLCLLWGSVREFELLHLLQRHHARMRKCQYQQQLMVESRHHRIGRDVRQKLGPRHCRLSYQFVQSLALNQ